MLIYINTQNSIIYHIQVTHTEWTFEPRCPRHWKKLLCSCTMSSFALLLSVGWSVRFNGIIIIYHILIYLCLNLWKIKLTWKQSNFIEIFVYTNILSISLESHFTKIRICLKRNTYFVNNCYTLICNIRRKEVFFYPWHKYSILSIYI